MKMIKTFNSILACGLLLMSIGFVFGQTTDERKIELVVQTGHPRDIYAIAFSSDGKLIATGGAGDDQIRIWDVESKQLIKSLKPAGMTNPLWSVKSLDFSPDSKFLISCGGLLQPIRLWNIETGQETKTLEGRKKGVDAVVFSHDGKTFATAGRDGIIKIWNSVSGKELITMDGHKEFVHSLGTFINSISFSPDNKTLISGGGTERKNDDGNDYNVIRIWDVESGIKLKELKGHKLGVKSIAISADGKNLISGGLDSEIKIWDLMSGKEIKSINNGSPVYSISINPDGKTFASVGENNTIKFWDSDSGQNLSDFIDSDSKEIYAVAFSPNGKILASGGFRSVKLWDLVSNGKVSQLKSSVHTSLGVALSSDGKMLTETVDGEFLKLWDLITGQIKKIDGHGSAFLSVSFSPDGKTIVSSGEDRTIRLWNSTTAQEIKVLKADTDAIHSLTLSPNGKILVSSDSSSGATYIWDAVDGNLLQKIAPEVDDFNQVFSFSSDSRILAVGSLLGKITLWDIDLRKKLRVIDSGQKSIFSIKFSPDNNSIMSVENSKVKFWSVSTGLEIENQSLSDRSKLFRFACINASINDKSICIDSKRSQKKIYNLDTGDELATLIELEENDWAVVTSDGRFDASEGALKLMHYAYGLEIINLEQLKEAYYEPGLLQKLLGYSKEPLRPIVPLKDVKLYPEIVSQTIPPSSTTLQVKLKNRGGGIGRVQVFVGNELGNKLAVEDARDVKLRANPNVPEATLEVDLRGTNYLQGKENKITVITSNYLKEISKGNIQSRGSEIVWRGDGKEEKDELPTLYAIIGGVSDYDGERLDLRFAAKDAEDFAGALSLGARKLFCNQLNPNCLDKVQITTLSTSREKPEEQPTKENFRRAFAEVAARAKPEDIVVVYLAGHGVSFGAGTDSYFYLTKEARTTSADELSKVLQTSTISSEELTDWLTLGKDNPDDIFIKAMKQVVILDTCASGNAAGQLALTAKRDLSSDQRRAVEFLKDKTGTFVLMASTADAPSYEASQFGQGLLTYSLLQAMKGAELDKGEYVDVRRLFSYAEREVPKMATNIGGVQKPIVSAPLGKTFVIGQMTDSEKQRINLPMPKPLMLRPLLTNPETGDDDLKLIPALRKLLDAESSYEVKRRSSKSEPALIYIDDDNFPGALRVTGTYTVDGDNIRLKALLRRDGKTISALPEILAAKENILNELFNAVQAVLSKN